MNEPKPPKDPPPPETKTEHGQAPHGIPDGAEDHEPKGRPHSDRHNTETVANKS